jgi:hypothetical protein
MSRLVNLPLDTCRHSSIPKRRLAEQCGIFHYRSLKRGTLSCQHKVNERFGLSTGENLAYIRDDFRAV